MSLVNSDTSYFKKIKDSLQKNKINYKTLSNGSKRYGIKKISINDNLANAEIFINSKSKGKEYLNFKNHFLKNLFFPNVYFSIIFFLFRKLKLYFNKII